MCILWNFCVCWVFDDRWCGDLVGGVLCCLWLWLLCLCYWCWVYGWGVSLWVCCWVFFSWLDWGWLCDCGLVFGWVLVLVFFVVWDVIVWDVCCFVKFMCDSGLVMRFDEWIELWGMVGCDMWLVFGDCL